MIDREEVVRIVREEFGIEPVKRSENKPEPIKPEIGMVGCFECGPGIAHENKERGILLADHGQDSFYRYVSPHDSYHRFTPDDPQPEPKRGDFGKFWNGDIEPNYGPYFYLERIIKGARYSYKNAHGWFENFRPCVPPAHIDIEDK
jgi:hypothetical protein